MEFPVLEKKLKISAGDHFGKLWLIRSFVPGKGKEQRHGLKAKELNSSYERTEFKVKRGGLPWWHSG